MLLVPVGRSIVLELGLVLVTPKQRTGLSPSQVSIYFEKFALLRGEKEVTRYAYNL